MQSMEWIDWLDRLHELAEEAGIEVDASDYRANYEAGQTPEEALEGEEEEDDGEPGGLLCPLCYSISPNGAPECETCGEPFEDPSAEDFEDEPRDDYESEGDSLEMPEEEDEDE